MIDRRLYNDLYNGLYNEVGGLSQDYLGRDFEDSDLCLALRSRGYSNWIAGGVELYQLETPSRREIGAEPEGPGTAAYDRWLQTRRWNSLMRETMSELPELGIGDP